MPGRPVHVLPLDVTNLFGAGGDSRTTGSHATGSLITSGVANPAIMTTITWVLGSITPWPLTPIRNTPAILSSASSAPLASVVGSSASEVDCCSGIYASDFGAGGVAPR